jgi:hypothetical protein
VLELPCLLRVVVGEVDGLADLGIALGDGLARLARHDLDEVCAAGREFRARPVQDACTLVRGEGAPGSAGPRRGLNRALEGGGIRNRRLLDRIEAELRRCGAGEGGTAPGAVDGDGRVGVRFVVEAGCLGRGYRGGPVLQPVGLRCLGVERIHRGEEAVALAIEQRLVAVQLKHGGHEVLLARVLFQATDEVGDGNGEFGRPHHGRVQQQPADLLLDLLGLAGGHSEEHLELDPVLHAALPGEQPREGDVEQVVAGDADLHGGRVLRGEGVVEHPQIVGVGLALGRVCGERPAVHGGIHVLHGEVGALDQAHLDGGTAVGPTLGRPLGEPRDGADGIRKIRLQHDARLEGEQLRLVEDALEGRDGQVEILVLLHVQVDELGGGGCRCEFEQRGEPVGDLLDRLVERPHGQLADHGRHLDGDVVDIVTSEQRVGSLEPACGLRLAQDGFAEEVEVEPGAAGAELGDRRSEPRWRRVHDEVAHHPAQHPARDRDDEAREDRTEQAAEPDGEAHVPGQEARGLPGDEAQVPARDPQVFRAHDQVDEADGEVEPVGILQHPGEALGSRIRRGLRTLPDEAGGEGDRVVREGGQARVQCCGVIGRHGGTTLSGRRWCNSQYGPL